MPASTHLLRSRRTTHALWFGVSVSAFVIGFRASCSVTVSNSLVDPFKHVSQSGSARAYSNCSRAQETCSAWADLMQAGAETANGRHQPPPMQGGEACKKWPIPSPCNNIYVGQPYNLFYIPGYDLLPTMWSPPAAALMRLGGPPWLDGSKQALRLDGLGGGVVGPDKPCIVYSVGGNLEVDFERELINRTECLVWQFDCTVNEEKMQRVIAAESDRFRERFQFRPWCLGASKLRRGRSLGDYRSLPSIISALGHDSTRLTYLKFDAEGAETSVIPDMVSSVGKDLHMLPHQLGVELHWPGKLEYLVPLFRSGYVLAGREDNSRCNCECVSMGPF